MLKGSTAARQGERAGAVQHHLRRRGAELGMAHAAGATGVARLDRGLDPRRRRGGLRPQRCAVDRRIPDARVRAVFTLRAGQYKKPYNAHELISSRESSSWPSGTGAPGDRRTRRTGSSTTSSTRDGTSASSGTGAAAASGGRVVERLGENETEDDDGKQIGARLNVEIVPGWTASGAWTGKRISEPPDADDATWYDAYELAVTGGKYGSRAGRRSASSWRATTGTRIWAAGTSPRSSPSTGSSVTTLPSTKSPTWSPSSRSCGWDGRIPSRRRRRRALLATPGLNVYFHPRVRTQVQADFLSPEEGEDEVAFRIHTVLEF